MKKILLTIDTEFYISEEEILGPKNKGGIDDILAMLNKYGVKATFFVDYYGAKIWGKSIYKRISEKILSNGHEIELHLHPEPGEKKPYLWQYSVDEQKVMLRYSIDTYREINGKDPDYFRAGSYSADDNLIGLLKDNNFHGDLSFQYKQRRCKISESVFQNMNRIKTEEEFIHIPTTVYKYNFLGKTKYNSVNFEWCTFGEFKDICGQIKSSSLDYFVLMMHSFGLLNRWDRKKVSFSKSRIKKLEKFLKFSIESGLEFETVSNVTAEAQNGKLNTSVDFLPIISDKKTIIKGVFEKLKNRLILKKKLRYSAYFAGITTLFFFLLFSYLFFFEHIDPGVKEIENVTADITSWNEDEDISTIESYFILLNNYKSKTIAHKDSNGILYREPFSDKKKYVYDFSAKRLYIPTDMSGKIIRDFDKYSVNGDTTLKKEMILYSKWLVDNAKIKENFAMWPYPFKMTKYDIEIGWCGSWALGNILSALSRSFVLTGDSLYYSVAQKGVNSFEVPIEEGEFFLSITTVIIGTTNIRQIHRVLCLTGISMGCWACMICGEYPVMKKLVNCLTKG